MGYITRSELWTLQNKRKPIFDSSESGLYNLFIFSAFPAIFGLPDYNVNILGKPLTTCSTDPMTGWTRDGTCKYFENDRGTHATCAELTWEFLEYSKSKGNDLMTPTSWGFPGLKEGDRWCLCCNRWNEVYQAYRRGEVSEKAVPKIVMSASHKKSLEMVEGGLDTVSRFALRDEL